MVNGRLGAVGSYANDIAAAIERSGAVGTAAITVRKQAAGGYTVELSGEGNGAELVLVAVTRHVDVAIASGENGGRRIAYANVVRDERKLAGSQRGDVVIPLSARLLQVPGADRYAIVVRQPKGGAVLAVRWLS